MPHILSLRERLTVRQQEFLDALLETSSRAEVQHRFGLKEKSLTAQLMHASRRAGIPAMPNSEYISTVRLLYLWAKEKGLLGKEWPE